MLSHNKIVEKKINGQKTYWYRPIVGGALLPAKKNIHGGFVLDKSHAKTEKVEQKLLAQVEEKKELVNSKDAKKEALSNTKTMIEKQKKISDAITKAMKKYSKC